MSSGMVANVRNDHLKMVVPKVSQSVRLTVSKDVGKPVREWRTTGRKCFLPDLAPISQYMLKAHAFCPTFEYYDTVHHLLHVFL